MVIRETERRKEKHVKVCLKKPFEKIEVGTTGLEDVTLVNTLPEINYDDVDTKTSLFGKKKLNLPLVIAAMTGGYKGAKNINKKLAKFAEKRKIGFGLGSQKAMIDKQELAYTYEVRDVAQKVLLFGNIGLNNLRDYPKDIIIKKVKEIKADALCVHINPAQELFQEKGDLNFSDSLSHLEDLCSKLDKPVIAKEVGSGVSREVITDLVEVGVKAIDVGGYGGTSWVKVASILSDIDTRKFEYWGIKTAASILEAKKALDAKKDKIPIIATGGIRTGLDIAKAIALGADVCGIALPFLKAQENNTLDKYLNELETDLERAMYLTNSQSISRLKSAKYVLTGEIKEWVERRKLF